MSDCRRRCPQRGTQSRRFAAALAWLLGASPALAGTVYQESEPNGVVEEFGSISGEITLHGTMVGSDRDGYRWTVSDDDARRRWRLELQGIPGAHTVVDIMAIEYADNGVDVAGLRRLMRMGTRDGSRASVHEGLLFDPGDYVLAFAQAGSRATPGGPSPFRLPAPDLSGAETTAALPASDVAEEPGAYRLQIQAQSMDVQHRSTPHATRDDARDLQPNDEIATYESGAEAWYRMSFDAAAAGSRWEIEVRAPLGRKLVARLVDDAGVDLASGRVDEKGRLLFSDLAPPVGTWNLELTTREPGFVQRVALRATGERAQGEEGEPNDQRERANRVDFSTPLTGSLGGSDREDRFLFTVDEAAAGELLSLEIESEAPSPLEVCLTSADWEELQCRRGKTPIVLPDLALGPGDWGLHLSRADSLSYRVTLETQGPAEVGREVEPNDTREMASAVPANLRVRGRFSGDEADHYLFLVAGEAQRWRFQIKGTGIESIASLDSRGKVRASARAKKGQPRLRLDNVFLPPGRHLVRVDGKQGEYTLLALPLGPPNSSAEPIATEPGEQTLAVSSATARRVPWNPDGELEPNDKDNMQRLAVGQVRTGTLPESSDVDFYRFFVAHHDHLRLAIEPPKDGSIVAELGWYGLELGSTEGRRPGEAITWEGLLPPGDYTLKLLPDEVSDASYRLTLERLPRFGCAVDCEPNGSRVPVDFAAALPPDLLLRGASGDWKDTDLYRLPIFEDGVNVVVHSAEPVARLRLKDEVGKAESLKFESDLPGYQASLAAGQEYRLEVDSRRRPYDLQLSFPHAEPPSPPGEPGHELALRLDALEVAAFLLHGQRIAGEVVVENKDHEGHDVTFEAATSDHRWSVDLGQESVRVPAGQSLAVPLTVHVPSDAWADHPVRISLRALDAGGRQAEAWAEVAVGRETTPVEPNLHWPIPGELRGGFNAAWFPFRAQWTDDTPERVRNDVLRDDLAYHGTGSIATDARSGAWKPEWTLELPGETPVPVAGVALDHFGSASMLRAIQRATLLLSEDGVHFEEKLRFETLPVLVEQHFVLDEPVLARFARLRIDATFESPPRGVQSSEWKVILEPGYDLSGGRGYDLAAPEHGGHLVWSSVRSEEARSVLDDDEPAWVHTVRGGPVSYVVGFHRNRAAQITLVEWQDSTTVPSEERRFERIEVFASGESPVGPWRSLGALEPGSSPGSLALALESPTWVRFLQFVAHPADPSVRRSREPRVLRAWERPTDQDYRSVLTEWGESGSRAFYEEQRGLTAATQPETDHGSRERAMPLVVGEATAGTVEIGRREAWYRVRIPSDINTLRLELVGDPTLRAVAALEDDSGREIRMGRSMGGSSPRRFVREAIVEPGNDVWVRVSEPPRNVIFSWDTSGSVGPYISRINNAVIAFSGEVRPGIESANLMPFGSGKLLERWSDEPSVLQAVLNDYRRERESSEAEATLHAAARALAPRQGAKAVVMVTDARTPFYDDLWAGLAGAHPRVFGLGVGGTGRAEQERFRDWASVNGGDFRQLRYLGEMEVAFDRAATLLRRPADYTLRVTGEYREAPGPGSLQVVAGSTAGSASAVALILDASGSMLQRLDGRRRIDIAREVLTKAVLDQVPAGTPLALRVFGHREPDSCRTDLEIPLTPLDPDAAVRKIEGINAMNLARTPIADSLAAVEGDLGGAKNAVVVLVTDGEETCGGDPEAVIRALHDKGLQVDLNIVGFAIDDAELDERFRAWAELGRGRYLSAGDAQELGRALETALRTSYTVFNDQGAAVATGVVDGEPVALERGLYRVDVGGARPTIFDPVKVEGEDSVRLELE